MDQESADADVIDPHGHRRTQNQSSFAWGGSLELAITGRLRDDRGLWGGDLGQ
jgi:hypothetical protein